MDRKKPSQPELIEDSALDAASGGLLPAAEPTALEIEASDQTESTVAFRDWIKKIEDHGDR